MKAVAEDFLCGVSIHCILSKDWSTCKAEYLRIVEELHDVLMTVSEMASMTFIKNHDYSGVTYFLNTTAIPLLADSGI